MPKVRKGIPELEKLVQGGRKNLSFKRKGQRYISWERKVTTVVHYKLLLGIKMELLLHR